MKSPPAVTTVSIFSLKLLQGFTTVSLLRDAITSLTFWIIHRFCCEELRWPLTPDASYKTLLTSLSEPLSDKSQANYNLFLFTFSSLFDVSISHTQYVGREVLIYPRFLYLPVDTYIFAGICLIKYVYASENIWDGFCERVSKNTLFNATIKL